MKNRIHTLNGQRKPTPKDGLLVLSLLKLAQVGGSIQGLPNEDDEIRIVVVRPMPTDEGEERAVVACVDPRKGESWGRAMARAIQEALGA